MNPDYQHLHNELWARQTAAIERSSSGALAAAAEARDAASRQMPEFVDSGTRVSARCRQYLAVCGTLSTAPAIRVISARI